MIHAQTQMAGYWGEQFSLTDSDIEQLYNHFLEVEEPQTIEQLAMTLMTNRVNEELRSIKRMAKGHVIYQPQNEYQTGDKLLFPAMEFMQGTVTAVREGFNPDEGSFNVISVDTKKKNLEFAANYQAAHVLNVGDGVKLEDLLDLDANDLYARFGESVKVKLHQELSDHSDFVELGSFWFVETLLLDIDAGHLHLSEAILEMHEGGPLQATDILTHLDFDPATGDGVQQFSLNYALLKDNRFDNVAPEGQFDWYLHRLEPDGVQSVPGRLEYEPIPFERDLLGPLLLQLERELDDEWSNLKSIKTTEPAQIVLTFPHRWAGTLPINSTVRSLLNISGNRRQRLVFIDDENGEETEGWVVPDRRYIFGFAKWFDDHKIPVGGYLHLSPSDKPGVYHIGFDRRRPQREWVRLATVTDNSLKFELKRRSIGCGYDDLLIVGTEVIVAVDALWRRIEAGNRSLVSLLAEIFPSLAALSTQDTVHAKTLYSAVNMLRRVPPGPIFAELVSNPAFQTVGDHYWIFDSSRWQKKSK
ncbi:MAG: hypothetical protein R3293_08090 [Candidatus Promineifilaceae bacterium]|nr:hypothetical protein [Candidatus Promineifilaceae bacterium]